MMKWTTERLENLCEINIGRTPSRSEPSYWGKGEPWVSISDLKSRNVSATKEQITAKAIRECNCRLVPKRTLLLSFKLSIGKLAFAGTDLYTNEAIAALPIKNRNLIDANYLYYALKFVPLSSGNNAAKGETLNKKSLADVRVPVPDSLQTQRQIAHLLSRAEELIAARQRSLALLDEFLKSTFLELFGDPVKNEKGWQKEPLGNLADIVSGVTKNTRQTIEHPVEVPYMRVANVQDGKLDLSEIKTIEVSQREVDKYQLQQGDILLTEGGDPDKLGRGAVWSNEIKHCIHQNHIFRVRVFNTIEPHYLCNLIGSRYGKNYFLKAAKQTTGIASINLNQLKNFPAYIPDPVVQATFGRIVNHIETLKTRQRESLAQLQNLYQSLLQRAFSGQLDVSGVRLPGEELPYLLHRPTSRTLSTRKTKLRSAARHRAEDTVTETDLPPTVAPSQTPPLMKLLSLTLHESFRSLPAGFHIPFMSADTPVEELTFAPYCLVGRNGSGKSNVLEALAAIFYHIDCIYLTSKPDGFERTEEQPDRGFDATQCQPDAFALSYLIRAPYFATAQDANPLWHIQIRKERGSRPVITGYARDTDTTTNARELTRVEVPKILPDLVVGYSSGENEVLSLPFFKMRFLHYDELAFWARQELPYERPEGRLVYLDKQYSEAVLLANFLMQPEEVMRPLYDLIGIEGVASFQLVLEAKPYNEEPSKYWFLPKYLRDFSEKLRTCATSEQTQLSHQLELGFQVNTATRNAFRKYFANSYDLFLSFQALFTTNLYHVEPTVKQAVYDSESLYVSETVPILPAHARIARFENVVIRKRDVAGQRRSLSLRALSDGEFQLLHSLGICLMLKDTNALFLLDEPETHFNPDWRARFISTLQACLQTNGTTESGSEMLITTHSPFLVSDTPRDNVLIFKAGQHEPNRPDFQSYGASADDITMQVFEREQTIGEGVYALLNEWRAEPIHSHADIERLRANTAQIGDSVEKIMFLNYLREQSKKLPVQSML